MQSVTDGPLAVYAGGGVCCGTTPDKESEECWTEFLHDMCGAPSRPEWCTNSAPSCWRLIVFVQ
jgi:hypothetical protein